LVEQERAVELPRGAHPGLELRADDGLAGGIAGVREQQRAEAAPGDLAPELGEGKVVAALGVEQDRDGREAPEDLEELLVRGVVRQKGAEVDWADGRAGAQDRDAAAAAHGDVLGAVFRGKPPPIERVVEPRHGLARLPEAGDRSVFLRQDRKSTRLNSSHVKISYAVFCLKKKKKKNK